MNHYQASLNRYGSLVLRAPAGRNPEELKPYGALKFRSSDDYFMPSRLQDLELMERDGIRVALPTDEAKRLARRDKLDRYLQAAQDLERAADHPHWQTLMPHQRVGVGYLASRERALLSFVPGLGKSATAIVAADVLKLQRVLVVAPLTLLPTWQRELNLWSADPAHEVLGTKGWRLDQRWSITNPEKMNTKAGAALFEQEWDLVVFDESILYKNRTAKRTKQAQALGERSRYVWMLSGAPVAAYADDLFSQLAVLRPDVFRSYWRFVNQWCVTQVTPWATDIVGNKNPEGLRDYLRDLMLSRTPEDVPGLLPDTFFQVVDVEMSKRQTKLLEQLRQELEWSDEVGQTNTITAHIAQLTRLSQAVSCPENLNVAETGSKVQVLKSLLKDEIAQLPALVWVHYRPTGEMVARELRAAGYTVALVHGGVSTQDREQALQQFSAGEVQVLVMQLQTGKFGLSLTEANSVIFHDRSFSFDDWTQSVARVRRLSSKGKVVPTYVLHGGWTDHLVDVILNRKLRSVHDLELSDLRELLGGGGSNR